MHRVLTVLAGAMLLASTISAAQADDEKKEVAPVLNFKMKSLTGQDVDLSKYHGKVVMMVNVASKCGYTPQYKDLEEINKKYAHQGLAILGFPANNFGQQEPGSNEEIGAFCKKNYGVDFDMFSKVSVKGDDIAPLYKFLTSPETDPKFPGEVQWNFEKFIISRDGQIVARYRSKVKPTDAEVVKMIETELAKK